MLFLPRRTFKMLLQQPRAGLNLAALAYVEHHSDVQRLARAEIFIERRSGVRRVRLVPVAAVRKDVRLHRTQRTGDAHVGVVRLVPRDDHPIHRTQRLDHLLTLLFRHERKSFFCAQPVVVVQNDHEFVAKRPRMLEHPHVADVERIKAAGNGTLLFFFALPMSFTNRFSVSYITPITSAMFQKIKNFLFKNITAKQTVAKNTVWLSISQFGARIIKAAIVIYAARVLGAAGYGVFSYAITLAGFFGIFVDPGINSVLIRDGAKATPTERQSLFSTTLIMKGSSSRSA